MIVIAFILNLDFVHNIIFNITVIRCEKIAKKLGWVKCLHSGIEKGNKSLLLFTL